MDVSALLAQYLSVKAQINYDQLQDTKWADLHKSMSGKLATQTKAEGKWETASDNADQSCGDSDKSLTYKGAVYKNKGTAVASADKIQQICTSYANAVAKTYDPDKLEEYAQLDTEYDMMQSMYDSLLEQLNSQSDSLKSTLGNATKDTGALES